MWERGRLRAINVRGQQRRREWADVAQEARKTGEKYHVGLVSERCVERFLSCPTEARTRSSRV
eukprot:11838360-Alexandrium_andersonii.AAC.1